jgi:hypothetical protein
LALWSQLDPLGFQGFWNNLTSTVQNRTP